MISYSSDNTGFLFARSPIDPSLLQLDAEEAEFFHSQTGIKEEKDLREHIVSVTETAYRVGRVLG
jgi:hypothetical protein